MAFLALVIWVSYMGHKYFRGDLDGKTTNKKNVLTPILLVCFSGLFIF